MPPKLVSIQGERSKVMPLAYVKCRAFKKHDLDGHVIQEKMGRKNVWIARLECSNCGTHRIDVMVPKTCELISRLYVRPDDYDTSMTSEQAKKLIYKHMLDNGVTLASLTG